MSTESLVVLESPNGSRVLAPPLSTNQVLAGVTDGPPVAKTIGVTLGGSTGSTTASITAEVRSGHTHVHAPLTKSANAGAAGIVADVAMANGAQTIAAQPDFPRKLLVFITDADSSVSAGTLDLVGVGASGEALSESISLTGGTATKKSTYAYAKVTTATVASLAGATGVDKVAVGIDSALGLVGNKTPASSSFACHKANVDNADETVGTVDATAGTVDPTTAPNGTRVFDFWYTYSVQPVESAHTHTLASGTATPTFT